MSITPKIIITDTNIITDLDHAQILDKFVKLDNVYISDMVKNDEINFKTGDVEIINKFKTIAATPEQILEISIISSEKKKLSPQDIINYVIARDNNCILATGDNRLKNYAENNNIEVIRTLKIIELMNLKNIITKNETIKACKLLLQHENTRIPKEDILNFIEELEN